MKKIRHMDDIDRTLASAEILMRLIQVAGCPSCALLTLSEAISVMAATVITDPDFEGEIAKEHILDMVNAMIDDQASTMSEFRDMIKEVKKEKGDEQQNTCFHNSRKTH